MERNAKAGVTGVRMLVYSTARGDVAEKRWQTRRGYIARLQLKYKRTPSTKQYEMEQREVEPEMKSAESGLGKYR
jgi:hypothetical protein